MSIHQVLNNELKTAMKNNDTNIKNYTRAIKSKLSEYCVANKIDRNSLADDTVLMAVILSHKKSLEKAVEMLGDSEKAQPLINEYKGEIEFCNKFLPSESDMREEMIKWVEEAILALNIVDSKQGGKIVGYIMKNHKDRRPDGSLIQKLVLERLSKMEE